MSPVIAADTANREVLELHGLGDGVVLAGVMERVADAQQWGRFNAQLRSSHGCRRPVRLRGRVDAMNHETGELRRVYSTDVEPDETLLKCCGNRREAVCPSCAETYRADAYQLVAAGLRGGKGVPESVAEHPMLFVTLTAPSFGPVHSRRASADGTVRRCRPRRKAPVCRHGVRLSCGEVHDEDDPRLGEPLCSDCFDYEHAVLWNAMAPELWRRTSIQIPRELARLRGLTQKELRERVRVSYIKVAEYQRRGALHFHLVVRLDCSPPRGQAVSVAAPAAEFDCELLENAVRAAVSDVSVLSPGRSEAAIRSSASFGGGRRSRFGRSPSARASTRGRVRAISPSTRRSRPRRWAGSRAASTRAICRTCACARTYARTWSVRGGWAVSVTCATCGCGGARTCSASAGIASRRVGATRRRSRRCGARGTSTCSSGCIRKDGATRGTDR